MPRTGHLSLRLESNRTLFGLLFPAGDRKRIPTRSSWKNSPSAPSAWPFMPPHWIALHAHLSFGGNRESSSIAPSWGRIKSGSLNRPLSGEKVCLCQTLAPEICLVHVQRADPGRECPGLGTPGGYPGTANAGRRSSWPPKRSWTVGHLKEPYKTNPSGFRYRRGP